MSAPAIVLVHGAFADSSGWRPLTDALAGDGLTILAPPNPLRGMTGGDGASVKAFVERIDGPVVLVGHSYGGAVISAAGTADNVVGLVFVAGFAPEEGESLKDLQSNFPAPPALQYFAETPLPDGGTEAWLSAEGFHPMFCADIPAADAAFMAITQRPLALVALVEEAPAPAWKSRPSWGVLGTADLVIHPDVHRFSFERAGATVTEVEGASHVVMISHPDVVADVVRTAARESARQPA
jgi:pimeloyl-ACP methyl ester carboxylesterase